MKRPCTSQPCSLRRRAATAESTPPERPTMTRLLTTSVRSRESDRGDLERRAEVESCGARKRLTPPGQIVIDAAQYERTAQLRLTPLELGPRQPMRAHDAFIQLLSVTMISDYAGEGETLGGATGAGMAPEVDPDELVRCEEPGGLFAHLADHGLEQRLASLGVSGGLIEDEAPIDALLDDEKAAGGLGRGRDGNLGIGHGRNYIPSGAEADLYAAYGVQPVLGRAGIPDLIEFLQVQARDRRIVDVRDAVPGIGAHAVDDGPVVRDEIGRGSLAGLRRDVADVDAAREPPPHGHEAVAVAHDA